MANLQQPWGLRPVRHINGSPWNGATIKGFFSADYATAVYVGDPVVISPTAAEDDTTNVYNYPKLNRSSAGDGVVLVGVVISFDPNRSNLEQQYKPASQERLANICFDPSVVYQIRGCGQGTPASDWIWRNAIAVDSGGSTVTGLSGIQLDEGTSTAPTNNQSNPFLIVGRSTDTQNSLADYCVWEVILNTTYNATGLVLGVTDA